DGGPSGQVALGHRDSPRDEADSHHRPPRRGRDISHRQTAPASGGPVGEPRETPVNRKPPRGENTSEEEGNGTDRGASGQDPDPGTEHHGRGRRPEEGGGVARRP